MLLASTVQQQATASLCWQEHRCCSGCWRHSLPVVHLAAAVAAAAAAGGLIACKRSLQAVDAPAGQMTLHWVLMLQPNQHHTAAAAAAAPVQLYHCQYWLQ
jgi:hypothetical protein